MALQGSLFKFVNTFSPLKSILQINRNALYNNQQHAHLTKATKEKIKDLKIPEKPKRPLSAYLRYSNEHRDDVKKIYPNLKITDISKRIALDWHKLDQNIKEQYSKEWQQEKEVYVKQIEEYKKKLTVEQTEAINQVKDQKKRNKKRLELKKIHKETDRPKRPMGPYTLFVMEMCKKEDKKFSQALNEFKSRWEHLSASEKQIYKRNYETDKIRYEREMAEWEKKMIAEGHIHLVRNSSITTTRPSRILKQKADGTE